jgi:hypothetical protein
MARLAETNVELTETLTQTTGPHPPQTGAAWFTYFRLYGPVQPYFDKTWVLPDIKLVK